MGTSVIFLRNRVELTSLNTKNPSGYAPKIAVCIPARNEEKTIRTVLGSLEGQDWPAYEVHVLDDRSSDNTLEVAESFQKKYPEQFFAHRGKEKPDDWVGKNWACHQLSEITDAGLLLFLDADTEVRPGTLKRVAASMELYHLDMLTVWPKQKLVTFWEQALIPLIYYTLLTVLPAIYVYRDPKWMPGFLRNKMRTKFAAGCGQFLVFARKAYNAIGGHKAVKNKIIEDVELARLIKKEGLTMRMFNGAGSVSCRMYHNEKEIFEGLRKNFLTGFNDSIPAFIFAGIVHLVVFVLPFITLVISIYTYKTTLFFLSGASVSLILIQRLILAIWYRFNPLYSLTHPVAVLWFEWLAVVKIRDYFSGRSTLWKGREV